MQHYVSGSYRSSGYPFGQDVEDSSHHGQMSQTAASTTYIAGRDAFSMPSTTNITTILDPSTFLMPSHTPSSAARTNSDSGTPRSIPAGIFSPPGSPAEPFTRLPLQPVPIPTDPSHYARSQNPQFVGDAQLRLNADWMSNDPLLLWSIHQINHPVHYYQPNRPSEFDGLSQPLTQYPIPLAGPPRLISGNPGTFSVNDSFAPTTSTSSIVIPTPPIVNPIVNRSVPSPSSPGLSRNTSSRHRASQVHQRRQSTAVTSSSTIEMTRPLRITRRQTESKAQQSVPRQHQPPPSSSPTVPKSPQSPQSSPLSLSPSPPTFSSRKRSTPFNCNWCAYVFPRRRDRDRHERSIHTRQAPYACLGGCNLAFVRTDARLRHWRANQQCYEEHVRVVLDSNETHL